MTYDNERRMTSWQSAPSNPGATAGYAYDGEGHRVAQSVTAGGSTTTTYYVAGLEEQANISGGTSTLTKYYSVPGVISAVNVGGTLSFLASDGLGSVSEALSSSSAAATSQQLYGPYGGLRYATGNMPTAKGYTGQYADAASSGLDYYNARYYDPLVGQFASADSTADGLNRYGYVAGNPETATDPSGHRICNGGDGCNGGDDSGDDQCRHGCGGGGGSGGSGGAGGNSGSGGDPSDHYCNQVRCPGSRPAPTCDAQCVTDYQHREQQYQQKLAQLKANQATAKQNASYEASFFHGLARAFAIIGASLDLILGIIGVATENPMVALLIVELSYDFAMLFAEANDIAAMFDDMKGWDASAFTPEAIRQQEARLDSIHGEYGAALLGADTAQGILLLIPKIAAKVGFSGQIIAAAGMALQFFGSGLMYNAAHGDLDAEIDTLHL